MSFSAVGIGDLHLTDDKGHGGLAKYIENPDQYVMSEVDRVLAWARKKHIDLAFLYGDIGDNPRMSYEAMLAFVSCIRRNKDIQFVVYRGNHDSLAENAAEGHSLQVIEQFRLKNLQIIVDDTYLELQGKRIKVCPWPSKKFDPKVLNFGHIEVNGAKLDSGRKIEDDELPKSKALICMGHLHTNHRVRNTFYSGTLYQTNFGEQPEKFFHHIEYNSVDDYEITSVPFKQKYTLHNCVIETQEDVDALPKAETDLIKLVVKDGADVVIPSRSNIVVNKTFKTKQDLTQILTEDLMNGKEMEIKTSKFFFEWLAQQTMRQSLKDQAIQIRKRVLGAHR